MPTITVFHSAMRALVLKEQLLFYAKTSCLSLHNWTQPELNFPKKDEKTLGAFDAIRFSKILCLRCKNWFSLYKFDFSDELEQFDEFSCDSSERDPDGFFLLHLAPHF